MSTTQAATYTVRLFRRFEMDQPARTYRALTHEDAREIANEWRDNYGGFAEIDQDTEAAAQ